MGNKLTISTTQLSGVLLVKSSRYSDERGSFSRWFCQDELTPWMDGQCIQQINHSINMTRGAVRGMHFLYPPLREFKLVRCIRGAVCDAVLDLRRGSASFLKYQLFELDEQSDQMVLIPPGCAHGFQALQDDSQLLYLHTALYQPDFDGGCRANDPRVNIRWPLPVTRISTRDLEFNLLTDEFEGLTL
jgi:dTDP-4-dehydrorhamnose 3,5-epimerase